MNLHKPKQRLKKKKKKIKLKLSYVKQQKKLSRLGLYVNFFKGEKKQRDFLKVKIERNK